MWIQDPASALTSDLDTFGKELLAKSKVQALGMKVINFFMGLLCIH